MGGETGRISSHLRASHSVVAKYSSPGIKKLGGASVKTSSATVDGNTARAATRAAAARCASDGVTHVVLADIVRRGPGL